MKNIVLLSYGSFSEYNKALGAIISFWSWYKTDKTAIRIMVYTDDVKFFKNRLVDIVVEYVLLTPDTLKNMLNNSDYIHRRKIAVVDTTFRRYPGEDLLFIDSDTFFFTDSSKLLNSFVSGESFMHKREFTFAEAVPRFTSFQQGHFPISFIEHIESKDFYIGGVKEKLHKEQFSWNSGVLGLTSDIATYMDDIFLLSDEFYKKTAWRISEQLAFGVVLQTKTIVRTSEQYIYHYWGPRQKLLMDSVFNDLFTNDFFENGIFSKTKQIRRLTKKWKHQVEVDRLKQEIENSFAHDLYLRGCKYTLYVTLKKPLDISSLLALPALLSQGIKKRKMRYPSS